ncbi:hypothetical protein [Clostridium sp. M14]|uniref:hypothetical protein n=1 Tax=Clostridium sp. M14 TaxID=2716311 RepID=UPI0013EE955C|nr:hypothetical protein [Clostridium sp. M14]MBZ9693220.1 hypothetical protein [Clostridium sp. M14]
MCKELSIEQQQEMDKVVNLLKGEIARLEKDLSYSNIIHHKAIDDYRSEVARLTWVSDSLSEENEELKKENQELKNLLHSN